MSSTLEDFFGDSRTAKKECLHCGGTEGELKPAVYDAYGVTHWIHPKCQKEMDAVQERKAQARRDDVARTEAMDEWEEPNH